MKTLRTIIFSTAICFMFGCSSHYQYTVIGKSGKKFLAPTLCDALVQCIDSDEKSCYYDISLITDSSGKLIEENSCREVRKVKK